MKDWTPVEDALPPDGTPVLGLWPDGATFPTHLMYTPDALIWDVDGDVDGPPIAWRPLPRQFFASMRADLGRMGWYLVWGLLAAGLIALAAPVWGLMLALIALGLWLYNALAQSLAEAVALGVGGQRGHLLGLVIAVGLALLPALVVGIIAFRVMEAFR